MAEAVRIDTELVRRGLARSRREATALVEAGRVSRAGGLVRRPSERVAPDEPLAVERPATDPAYASRAAFKLEGALRALERTAHGVDIRRARCLDLGASTGGFTDVLLRRGAAAVVALDVGHEQLVERLRDDPRVDAREGVNVRDLKLGDLPEPPQVVVGDLSFISLHLVLPVVAAVTRPGAAVLLLVKPQFEVGRERLGRGGIVRNPDHMVEVVVGVARFAAQVGLTPCAVVPSALPGPHGNREFVLRMERRDPASVAPDTLVAAARGAVESPVPEPEDEWSAPPVPTAFTIGPVSDGPADGESTSKTSKKEAT